MRKRFDNRGGGCCVTLDKHCELNGTDDFNGKTGPAATGISAGIALA